MSEIPKLVFDGDPVVVSKYFRGPLGTPPREYQRAPDDRRVVNTIRQLGRKDGYFAAEEDAQAFADELTYILCTRKPASQPGMVHCGIEEKTAMLGTCSFCLWTIPWTSILIGIARRVIF